MDSKVKRNKRIGRHRRIRAKISGTVKRPRLSVFRSHKNVFLQLIDDVSGKTLASAGSHEVKEAKGKTERTKLAGRLLADRAKKLGIKELVFDRGGYQFHGRVKSIAEILREEGLKI